MWGKWVKNGSTHLVVYIGGTESLPSGHDVTDAAMENAVGQDADFLFLGQLNADVDCPSVPGAAYDDYAFERNVRLVSLSFQHDGDYETITYVGFSLGALDFEGCVEQRNETRYDMGIDPKPTRTISVGSGKDWIKDGVEGHIEIKSTGDRHCPYKNLNDDLVLEKKRDPMSEYDVLEDMHEIKRSTLLMQPGRNKIVEEGAYPKLKYPHSKIGSEIINCGILYTLRG